MFFDKEEVNEAGQLTAIADVEVLNICVPGSLYTMIVDMPVRLAKAGSEGNVSVKDEPCLRQQFMRGQE
jgi:hypothetical protein